jgi:hypothetical protein
MCKKIRERFDQLLVRHPSLKPQLETGLLLALGGAVKTVIVGGVEYDDIWQVSGGTVDNGRRGFYTVELRNSSIGTLWHCSCKAFEFNTNPVDNFDIAQGRVCKHVAAVALSRHNPLEPVTSVFKFLARLVAAQWLPQNPGDSFALPGTRVKVLSRKSDGRIVLRQGYKVSNALVEPRTVEGGATHWDFSGEDRHFVFIGSLDDEPGLPRLRYDEWVKSLGGDDE